MAARTTLMWEAVATDADALVAWARSLRPDGMLRREVFVSADDRVVLILDWRAERHGEAADLAPPPGLCAREPHVWWFTRVDTTDVR